MRESDVLNDAPLRGPRSRTVLQGAAGGLCVAVLGSTLLGLLESSLAALLVHRRLQGEEFPPLLWLAALGKAALSHALLWCPIMVLAALMLVAVSRRIRNRPEPALWAVFVLLAGITAGPVDLASAFHHFGSMQFMAYVVAAVLAVGAYFALALAQRLLGGTRLRRIVAVITCLSLLLIVGATVALVGSPFYKPDGYRVSSGRRTAGRAGKPNVLWIVLDTVRGDKMSCHGFDQPTTPFLDEFAQHAVVCDHAFANGIWTLPGHASMFTGLSLRQHGAHSHNLWLDDEIETVADVLKSNGYSTAAFSNNPWIVPATNVLHGFNVQYPVPELRRLGRFSLAVLMEEWGLTPTLPWFDDDWGAALTNYAAVRWLDRRSGHTPFLLFLNYMDAHLPYTVPKRYRRMFLDAQQVQRSYDLRSRAYGNIVDVLDLRYNTEGPDVLPPADREIVVGLYLAGIRYLDDRVREMVAALEQRGLLGNTLVVITSDHGEYLGTHGMWAHRFLAYDDVTRVSILVREPGRETGVRITTPVQLSDLYPTILNATLGTSDAGPGFGVRDLLALAQGDQPQRIAVMEYEGPDQGAVDRMKSRGAAALHYRLEPQIAATDGQFKYMVSSDGRRELYDLLADPGELNNLITDQPLGPAAAEQAERLAAFLDTWRSEVPEHQPQNRRSTADLPAETVENLRALGYLDSQQPTSAPRDE